MVPTDPTASVNTAFAADLHRVDLGAVQLEIEERAPASRSCSFMPRCWPIGSGRSWLRQTCTSAIAFQCLLN